MAFTRVDKADNRYREELEYGFFGADGTISESVNPEAPWKLATIRLHCSVAFASVEYLLIRMSSGLGSAYNTKIYSANFSGTEDLMIHFSEPLAFLSDDQLNIELSMVSGTNVVGIQVDTWAARG